MRVLAVILTVILTVFTASAQQIQQLAGNYSPYPDKETEWHKAPAGYKPVYLAHLGRHGSRFQASASNYETLLSILEKAAAASVLNDEGLQLLTEVRKAAENARGHYGSLTDLGFAEHRHIMQRLCSRYPELFASKAWKVKVYSANMPRCLISMATSTDAIKEFNPKIEFCRQCDESTQNELFDFTKIIKALSNADSFLVAARGENINTQPLIDKFFNDGGRELTAEHRKNFGILLLDIAAGAYEDGIDIWKFLTVEEMFPYWKQKNVRIFHAFGPSEKFSDISKESVSNILLNMLQGADAALSGGEYRATLMYGRDTHVAPLTDLLGIEGCCTPVGPGQAIDDVWRDYNVTPMAANIQMLFFRKGKSEDILVKVLLNEEECKLEGIETDKWPYYHWKDVRRTLYDRIKR